VTPESTIRPAPCNPLCLGLEPSLGLRHVALLLPITWVADVQMTNARPFSISTFQDLYNDTKNTPMQGELGLADEL